MTNDKVGDDELKNFTQNLKGGFQVRAVCMNGRRILNCVSERGSFKLSSGSCR